MPGAPTSGSIRGIVKERFLNVIREVQTTTGWKVVVLDAGSVGLINSACRMSDLMEEGVSLVENLEIRRKPMPSMEAIYIISPSEISIEKIKADFEDAENPMYAGAHIYLTSHLPNDLIYALKQCEPLVSRVKTLKELNLEFMSLEEQCFSLALPDAFHNLYSPVSVMKNSFTHKIADRLLTLCITLGERPVIRYKKSDNKDFAFVEKIAKAVDTSLNNFAKSIGGNNSWWQPSQSNPATLLIVQRADDALSPAMHEYTYQAMLHDVMGLKDGKHTYKTTNAQGQEVSKETVLNEEDPLFPKLRHQHIADAINGVLDDFNQFCKDNKAASLAKGEAKDMKQLAEAIKSMPQYKELVGKYSMHIALTEKLMSTFETMHLEEISTEEQNMAMNEDPNGKVPKNLKESVTKVLESSIQEDDKLRLIMIFIITQEGLTDDDISKLVDSAKFRDSEAAKQAVNNLKHLGVELKEAPEKPKGMMGMGAAAAKTLFPFMKTGESKPRRDTDVSYDLSRYRPPLQWIMQDALENKLDATEFPCAGMSGPTPPQGPPAVKPKQKAGWADKGAKKEAEKDQKSGPRLIVFVAGGLCYSELRAAYELTKKFDREVIIGSTEILTPERYLKSLTSLNGSLPSAPVRKESVI